ncbi:MULTISPECIES: exodeoxyribonuclease VII small subunit [Methylovorus]|jgi:exodeoxyribonuclease VII small subunit|uniref:Exodeoxyribonuclease 7 small subunit n=1 Tax=Methylovorus glucosotrophus (strain SIP3-4) TaxID=582744 RepID=C6X9M6_METGS|nr:MULTISPECIES: exodeoxyribonuclease VII small subunit [Methylovorus]ACT49846.1 exodeoxyribonuclease VII, small subunit [Methylovorus glucosotrophus SIP3-4]ADQ83806.1 exodeoxyribonuclease VII, small subunit [Methylovorus sp. MP688]KAF0836455.1 exodeoxyribonuclease VII small subunit [Methylovorus glucosotrophus]MCB4810495.1 exodeoxyribonuclease VII small subunit [Methylovorus menthalis]
MSKKIADAPLTYESAVSELEALVQQMETNQLPLELSLAAYKRGAELLKFCQQTLADVDQQVQILNDTHQLKSFSDQQ